LERPGGTWMGGDIAMDQAPSAVLDHHETRTIPGTWR
jgi:hypothetical protein